MAQQTAQKGREESIIVFGENYDGVQSSQKAYFFAVTSQGMETPLYKNPFITTVWTRPKRQDQTTGTRIMEMCFFSCAVVTIKMAVMATRFGHPALRKFLYMTLDSTGPRIQVTGPSGFGMFRGRAHIDEERTVAGGLPANEIQTHFIIDVLSQPVETVNNEVRSITIL